MREIAGPNRLTCHIFFGLPIFWTPRKSQRKPEPFQVITTFEQFDTDANGLISRAELKAVLTRQTVGGRRRVFKNDAFLARGFQVDCG